MINHHSFRSNVAGSVLVMGFVGIFLAVLLAETYREYAIDSQRAGFEQIIGLRVDSLFDELASVSHDLGQALQDDKKFRAFLRKKDAVGLDEYLQSQFHQYFVTAGIVKLESLAVYDTNFTLFSRALSDTAPVDADCPNLHVRAGQRKGASRLKTITELCLANGKPYYSMLLPIGGLRIKGYLEVVTDPVYSMRDIESSLGLPIRIRYLDGKTAYESSLWPEEKSPLHGVIANFSPNTEMGGVAFTLSLAKDVSEFEAQLESTRNIYITFAVAVSLLLAVVMISILNRTTVMPLRRLSDQLRSIRYDKKHLGEAIIVSGNSEVSELAKGFNEMTDELKTLYDTLLSRNDELSLEVSVRESAEKELKKHRDHLEVLVEQRTLDLASARDAALDASRSKSLFLANMSHELRTPLNAIIGYSEILMEDMHHAELQHGVDDLEKIHFAGRHLLSLINDILDLTKIEAGKMDVYEEWFDIAEMLNNVVDTVHPLFIKNGNKFEMSCPDDIGDLYADLIKLRQSLFNLLSNAGKFAVGGNVTLTVRRESLNGQDQLSFSVKDDGIGMSQEQQEKLFEAFSQADPSTTRKYGGTGLGLVISQHFCSMMGGDIHVASTQGVGSTFTIILPVNAGRDISDKENNNAVQRAWHTGMVAAGKRFSTSHDLESVERRENVSVVLVIDDDPAVRQIVSHFLGQKGFDVKTVSSGQEGLEFAEAIQPDVIVLDVMMPEMDGWHVLKTLKKHPELSAVPVILLTMVENRSLGFSLGAEEYLSKPVDKERLYKVINRCVRYKFRGPILIIEANDETRQAMHDSLEEDGWGVDVVADAESALAYVENTPPALIVLEMAVLAVDAFDFIEQLRHNPRWRTIPVVVITSSELSESELYSLHVQSASVVHKAAFSNDELLCEVRKMVEKALAPQEERMGAPGAKV